MRILERTKDVVGNTTLYWFTLKAEEGRGDGVEVGGCKGKPLQGKQ